jgi:hypothetical protein
VNSAELVEAFRNSVTGILLSQLDFIDWNAVTTGVAGAEQAADQLEAVRREGELTPERLAKALGDHPGIYDVALTLIAFTTSGSQVSKWGLGAFVPVTVSGREHLARQLLHIGLGKVLAGGAPVSSLLRVAEVYKDSFRRRFRSGDRFSGQVNAILRDALIHANSALEVKLDLQGDALADTSLRRALDYVVAVAGRPIVGIATVFQNQSGGRQQRDLTITYPILQQKLSEYGMALVLIADGQGMAEASERALVQMFEGVRYPMTLRQAREGALQGAFVAAAQQPAPESLDAAAISRLIGGALDARDAVTADELPLANGPAVLALARYAETHRSFALTLASTGQKLSWSYPGLVDEARKLSVVFDSRRALDLLAERIGSKIESVDVENRLIWSTISTPDQTPFTGRLVVGAHGPGLSPEIRANMSRHTLEHAPGAAFSILLAERDLTDLEVEAHRKRQGILPANIVVVGPRLLRRLARAAKPLEILNEAVLDQSDLTKVSPFILSNATPTRMFFGRLAEAATISGTVGTNSVALLGSRRIGKTSLLRHVRAELEEANFLPFFGDCQTVRTWQDFADLAKTQWGVETSENFRPQHLVDLTRALGAGSDKPVVILLDEIDQLLEWDRKHEEDAVPEAFFRACRSLSQEGLAQFVFSGERTIAQRIWDPQSPHWNFCRPLPLAQLTREAATALLIQPLHAVGIRITDEAAFGAEAWRFTSGHPQIVQHLGDRLVRRLDAKPDRRALELGVNDIVAVAETYDFAEHYLNTYWGQATPLEREISLMVAKAPVVPSALLHMLKETNPTLDETTLQAALRMLRLYGLIAEEEGEISLRAVWFNDAQSYFGGDGLSKMVE